MTFDILRDVFAVPYPPQTFTVTPNSNTSLTVVLGFRYLKPIAHCSNFRLTTEPASKTKTVPCNSTTVLLDRLSSNTHYLVSVQTEAKYPPELSRTSRPRKMNSWTRTSFFVLIFFLW